MAEREGFEHVRFEGGARFSVFVSVEGQHDDELFGHRPSLSLALDSARGGAGEIDVRIRPLRGAPIGAHTLPIHGRAVWVEGCPRAR